MNKDLAKLCLSDFLRTRSTRKPKMTTKVKSHSKDGRSAL